MSMVDEHEKHLYRSLKHYRRESSRVNGATDVLFPSPECAQALLVCGADWNWLHMAVDMAILRRETQVYHSKCRVTSPELAAEPVWLALYFAFLTFALLLATEEEQQTAGLPYGEFLITFKSRT